MGTHSGNTESLRARQLQPGQDLQTYLNESNRLAHEDTLIVAQAKAAEVREDAMAEERRKRIAAGGR